MRALHRWIGSLAAIFTLYIAVTGLALHIDYLTQPPMAARPGAGNGPGGVLQESALQGWLASALTKAGDADVTRITLRIADGTPRADIALAGGRSLSLDPQSGADIPPDPAMAAMQKQFACRGAIHSVLERLHRGNIVGRGGELFATLIGFALLVLALTGLWVYGALYLERWARGRKALFWK